jgi:hypothetical protein
MARACSICTGTQRTAIDTALIEGVPLEAVAAQVGISKSAIGRHKLNCLAPRLAAAARLVAPASQSRNETTRAQQIAAGQAAPTLAEAVSYSGLVDTLARSLDRLERAADSAASDKAVAALAAVSGQLHKAVEVAARLAGLNKSPDDAAAAAAPKYSLRIVFSGDRASAVIEGTTTALPPPADAEDEPADEIHPAETSHLRVPDFGHGSLDADAGRRFSVRFKSSTASPA